MLEMNKWLFLLTNRIKYFIIRILSRIVKDQKKTDSINIELIYFIILHRIFERKFFLKKVLKFYITKTSTKGLYSLTVAGIRREKIVVS
jgi:hypothetical protein